MGKRLGWTRRRVLRAAGSAAVLQGLGLRALAQTSLVGRPAPNFSRQAFDGRTVTLHDMRGHVVLLNFWASWCAPCLEEMPVFDRWNVKFSGRGLNVVGVNMDDDPEPIRTVVSRLHVNYPMVHGDAGLAQSFGGVLGLPVTFLIDRKGTIRRRLDGAVDAAKLEAAVVALLGQG